MTSNVAFQRVILKVTSCPCCIDFIGAKAHKRFKRQQNRRIRRAKIDME